MPPRKRKSALAVYDSHTGLHGDQSGIMIRTRGQAKDTKASPSTASSSSSAQLVTPATATFAGASRSASGSATRGKKTSKESPIELSSDESETCLNATRPKRARTTRAQPTRASKATKINYVVDVLPVTSSEDSDLDMPIALAKPPSIMRGGGRARRTAAAATKTMPSPAPTAVSAVTGAQVPGMKAWSLEALALTRKTMEGRKGCWKEEGYVGLEGTYSADQIAFRLDGHTVKCGLTCEDVDGRKRSLVLCIAFFALDTYPVHYETVISLDPPGAQTPSLKRTFDRFLNVHNLRVPELLTQILLAVQGDDEASGGRPVDPGQQGSSVADDDEDGDISDDEDEDHVGGLGEDEMFQSQERAVGIGRGFETAKGSSHDMGAQWSKVKEDFAQAKIMGYRPGLTQVSDDWVISYSIPFKNIGIDPNELALWDDGLAEAWADDQRFTMLIRGASYSGVPIDQRRYFLTLDKNYKPSEARITEITRGKHDASALSTSTSQSASSASSASSFFLSDALVSHLKSFPLAYAFRTTYPINWTTADKYALDQMLAIDCRENGRVPTISGPDDEADDPVMRGWITNLPLVAFHWILRRFRLATMYCLNCGQQMSLRGMRPYVCDNALCFFTMMSMGLGPSVEHSIRAHPSVCDILLSFAHASLGGQSLSRTTGASSDSRMDLPLCINLVVPADICQNGEATDLDVLPDAERRPALIKLIESLPAVSALKADLDAGKSLASLVRDKVVSDGAITVLRWVICSCRAYLKEVKPGQGVVSQPAAKYNNYYDPYGTASGALSENIKQFTFVVGNPEQEDNFRKEIEIAKQRKPSLNTYPTMLAFHGSAVSRWHNILRTGLDFAEIACGRAYGNGVYFAAQAETSFGSYAVASSTFRPNADLQIVRSMALVELVNVPETFVASNPYYVNSNVKQIKPFLLLVQTKPESAVAAGGVSATGTGAGPAAGGGGNGSGIGANAGAAAAAAKDKAVVKNGRIFQHDPALVMKPTWFGQPLEVRMPDRLVDAKFIDTQPDSASDKQLYDYAPKKTLEYSPAPKSRYAKLHMMPNPTYTSTAATKAIMKEHKVTMKVQEEAGLPFWLVPDGDTVYSWAIEMFEFPKDSQLWKDMKAQGVRSIIAEVRFPDTFPASPPFIRVLHPRFMPFIQGGGGNITAGGSICNEILTSTGWNPCFTVEAIVRDVMVNMTQATPPGRLASNWDTPYGVPEAMEAYKRVATQHGWAIPNGFDKMAR